MKKGKAMRLGSNLKEVLKKRNVHLEIILALIFVVLETIYFPTEGFEEKDYVWFFIVLVVGILVVNCVKYKKAR